MPAISIDTSMLNRGYRNILVERAPDAIRQGLNELVGGCAKVVSVEGYESPAAQEHFWIVRFWIGGGLGSAIRFEPCVATIRFPVDRDMNPMTEFYRRAAKRVKLFVELARDQ